MADISVPATLQAVIAARIDRLGPGAKQTINAAAVIGSRFIADLLTALGVDPVLDDLVGADLIDQVRFTPHAEYAFRHPVIRTVAYESQLKSARAQLHRRLASAIESRDPASADENASLIAEHLEAAGDLHAAYAWHMRSGAWSSYRDIDAARLSWRRALRVADALPADLADRLAMRIAPRTMLCGTTWRGTPEPATDLFDELRELCAEAGDKASLAIAMTGLVSEHWRQGRMQVALEFASEQIALVESLGDPALMVSAVLAIAVKANTGATGDLLRWCEATIGWAGDDPAQDSVVTGSPLAMALGLHGFARWWHGRPGWCEDLEDALAIGRTTDPATLGFVTAWKYGLPRDMCLKNQFPRSELPLIELFRGYDKARDGDYDNALPQMRKSVEDIAIQGQFAYQVGATALLVETLIGRAASGDLAAADAAVDRLAAIPGDEWAARDIMVLRLRALLAKARGDADYHDLRDRYHAMAMSLGFEGHMQWAEALP